MPSRPRRASSVSVTRRNWLPVMVGHPVMPGQALVDERVVGRHQVEDAAVLVHDGREEELGLLAEGLAQVVVEVRELVGVRRDGAEVAQMQPLAGEVLDERGAACVRQHPPHLGAQHRRLAQAALGGQRQQFLVGNRAPQEERQPRRQFEIADGPRLSGREAGGVVLDAEDERRAREQAAQRQLDAGVERSLLPAFLEEGEQPRAVRRRHRTPIGAPRQRGKDLRGALRFRRGGLGPRGRHAKMRRRLGVSPGPVGL